MLIYQKNQQNYSPLQVSTANVKSMPVMKSCWKTSTKKLQIEARVMGEVANTAIIPAAIAYQNSLIANVKGLKEIGVDSKVSIDIVKKLTEHLEIVKTNIDAMLEERKVTNKLEDTRDKAIAYDEKVKTYFEVIRYHADKLEQIVDDSVWPLPKFRELLFMK